MKHSMPHRVNTVRVEDFSHESSHCQYLMLKTTISDNLEADHIH